MAHKINPMFDPMFPVWERNYRTNISRHNFDQRNIRSLRIMQNKHGGRTCVLVAAAPHLVNNAHLLKPFNRTYYIICCDVVMPYLKESGVIPNYVITIDPNEVIEKYINHVDPITTTLICSTASCPGVYFFPGLIYCFNQQDKISFKRDFFKALNRPTPYFPDLVNLDFVGLTMYQVARYMGFKTILLAGYGFGYLDGKMFCPGVLETRGEKQKKPAIQFTSETLIRYCQYMAQTIGPFRTVEELDAEYESTHKVSAQSKDVINCTEGGLLTCNNMRLEEALLKYGGQQ